MRTLKLFMDQPNYMCILNTHIFFNFNKDNFEWLNSMNPESIRTVHIFITTHTAINGYLKSFIEKYGSLVINGKPHYVKIIIHFPRQVKELELLLEEFVNMDNVNFYKSIVESNGPVFVLDGNIGYYAVSIVYGDTQLSINMLKLRNSRTLIVKFSDYQYNVNDNDNDPGIFNSADMRLNPNNYKTQLVEAFKSQCPDNILSSFRSDDDIWDYIMQQGSWSINDYDE